MTRTEKRAIAEKALRKHPDMSNRGLAELTGFSEYLFRKIRGTRPHDPEAKRTGRDGKEYPAKLAPPPVLRDGLRSTIPAGSAASITWRDFAPTAEIAETVKAAWHRQRRRLMQAQAAGDIQTERRLAPEVRDLRNAYEALRRSAPFAVCPGCRGKGCDTCDGRGMVTQLTWNENHRES